MTRQESRDPLEEAEVLLAYGRHAQAPPARAMTLAAVAGWLVLLPLIAVTPALVATGFLFYTGETRWGYAAAVLFAAWLWVIVKALCHLQRSGRVTVRGAFIDCDARKRAATQERRSPPQRKEADQ